MKSETYKSADVVGLQKDDEPCSNVARTRDASDTSVAQGRSRPVLGGRVYFIRAGTAIKIGYTTNVIRRLMNIQMHCPLECELLADIPGTRKDEAALHLKFGAIHIRGEWHQEHPDLLRYIRQVAGDNRKPISHKRMISFRNKEKLTYG